MKPARKLSINDLEAMTTHELSDLLANIVLVLRRLPDVPMRALEPTEVSKTDATATAAADAAALVASMRKEATGKAREELPDWADK